MIVPKGVEEIQQGAFQGCSALRSLSRSEGLKYISGIDGNAFAYCSSLEAILFLGKGKASSTLWLSDDPFHSCGALRTVTFLKDACTRDSRVFRGCANLESILAFAEVVRVGAAAVLRRFAKESWGEWARAHYSELWKSAIL